MARVLILFRFMLVASLLWTAPLKAQDTDQDRLTQLMRIGDTARIMREEGLRYGAEIGAEMLSGVNPTQWEKDVGRIYDVAKMERVIEDEFRRALEGEKIDDMVAFFSSDLGLEVVALELAAREAFLDEATELAANDAFEIARADQSTLYKQVETIIADSDLIEFNVMGAMNANLMFYRGLADGGAIDLGEDDILADVWAQEAEIRADSEAWLGAFLMMAYRPLSETQLEAYADIYRTPQGKVLNSAIFSAYDRMYDEISYLLGQAVAQHLRSEDL